MKQRNQTARKVDMLNIVEYITVGLFSAFSLVMGVKMLNADKINMLTFTICTIIGGIVLIGYVILRRRFHNDNGPYLFR